MYFLYSLYYENFDRYYVGSTENVEARLFRHNSKMVPSNKSFSPWVVVYIETFFSRSEAVQREKEIKRKKSRKYIESFRV